ncbi:hypothetical protein ACWDSE_31850, partial [Micromonospora chersina]
MSDRPRLLPLLGATRHGARDAMTCQYRCGNACDHPVPNRSANPYFGDLVDTEVSRRGVAAAEPKRFVNGSDGVVTTASDLAKWLIV